MAVKKLVRSDDGLQREEEGDTCAWPLHLEEGFVFPEVGGRIGATVWGESQESDFVCGKS